MIRRAMRPVASAFGLRRVHEPYTGGWQRNAVHIERDLTAFSAVYACVTILSNDIAKLPLTVQRSLPNGAAELAKGHPIQSVLRRPNAHQTRLEFIQQLVACLLLHGNAYALVSRDARGVVSGLTALQPHLVAVYVTEEGAPAYRVSEDPWSGVVVQEMVPARDILHLRINTLFHPLIGVSPIYAAASSANAGLSILDSGAAFFSNRAIPAGQVVTASKIDENMARRIREAWDANYGQGNQGKVAVLGSGMEWKPLTMSATDAQLIEQLKFSVEDVARVFRVPAHKLGDLTKASYRNVEQLERVYYSGGLSYLLENIETRLDATLDLALDCYTEFNLDALFRMETDARFGSYQVALNSGWISINEVRAKEGLPPVKGGESPRLQVQYRPIDQPPAVMAAVAPGDTPPSSPAAGGDADPEEDEEDGDDA
jgi:HK97 family phage portal protein